jgi:hypothetical protein
MDRVDTPELKAWNKTVGSPLRSFHLEAQAWSIFGTSWFWSWFSGTKRGSDWEAARFFFDKATSVLKSPLADPAGTGKDVGAYLHGSALETALTKVATASKRSHQAEECAKSGDLSVMHNAYRQVFGDYYPA